MMGQTIDSIFQQPIRNENGINKRNLVASFLRVVASAGVAVRAKRFLARGPPRRSSRATGSEKPAEPAVF